jgi:hypothetical protein
MTPLPHGNWATSTLQEFKDAFSTALQKLLEEKHLYQAVLVDLSLTRPPAARGQGRGAQDSFLMGNSRFAAKQEDPGETLDLVNALWYPEGCAAPDSGNSQAQSSEPAKAAGQSFVLPPVRLKCADCQERTTFRADLPRCTYVPGKDAPDEQSLLLSYECQACGNKRLTFLVTRKGARMQLSGRDSIEMLPVPPGVPKAVAKYFAEAQAAHSAGQALAALYLLREFVVQFWRLLPELKDALAANQGRDGREIAEIYAAQLPIDFRTQYPSLSNCHQSLCEAIDAAETPSDVFQVCSSDILEHIDGRRFRRLSGCSSSPFGKPASARPILQKITGILGSGPASKPLTFL